MTEVATDPAVAEAEEVKTLWTRTKALGWTIVAGLKSIALLIWAGLLAAAERIIADVMVFVKSLKTVSSWAVLLSTVIGSTAGWHALVVPKKNEQIRALNAKLDQKDESSKRAHNTIVDLQRQLDTAKDAIKAQQDAMLKAEEPKAEAKPVVRRKAAPKKPETKPWWNGITGSLP